MSAFQHDPQHVAAIVGTVFAGRRADDAPRFLRYGAKVAPDGCPLEQIASILMAENARSVGHRYADDGAVPVVTRAQIRRWQFRALSPVACLKAIDSLAYQSCESPDWRETAAHGLLDFMRGALIKRLSGYEDADTWAVTAPPSERRRA